MDIDQRLNDLEQRIEKLENKGKKKKGEVSEGSEIFKIYEAEILQRHKVAPVRNLKVNLQCAELVKRLGLEDAKGVVRFYVLMNDPFYIKNMHPLNILVANCESICMAYRRGSAVSLTEANKISRISESASAQNSYLAKKHGQGYGQK